MEHLHKSDKTNDNYSTPPEVWENIKQYLPTNEGQVVWEPFFNTDSKSPCHLSALGCNVLYSNADFFASKPVIATHIVTNPPFSCKEKVFQRLSQFDLPFIVILPQSVYPFQRSSLRLHFEKTDGKTGARKTVKRTPFDSIYACYRMDLPRDLIWL